MNISKQNKLPDPSQVRPLSNNPSNFAIIAFVVIFLMYAIGSAVLTVISDLLFGGSGIKVATGIGQILFMLIPAVYAIRRSPLSQEILLRLPLRLDIVNLLIAILGLIGLRTLITGWAAMEYMLLPEALKEIYESLNEILEETYVAILSFDSVGGMILTVFAVAIIPGICEEVFFRGLIQRSFEEKMKTWLAIVITAVIFGLVHLNPITFTVLSFVGIYLGLLAKLTQSLSIPIIIHILNNLIALIIFHSLPKDHPANEITSLHDWTLVLPMIAIGFIIVFLSILLLYKRKNPTEILSD